MALVESAGIKLPRVYAMGFKNANCTICCKATSPDYYALVRQYFPEVFNRFNALCRELNCRPVRIKGKRCFPDEIPEDWPTTEPIAPECDFLCQMVELK